jgi:hypothetical protein
MSVMLHTDVNYMHFVHFLLILKQVHNYITSKTVFFHIHTYIISDYMENPRPTFVNSLEKSMISILHV